MPFFTLTKFYYRQQGNITYNFYINKDKQLVAETMRDGQTQQLQIDIPRNLRTNLDEKKISKLQVMFDQCYFSIRCGKILVNARGLGGWNEDVHRGKCDLKTETYTGTWYWAAQLGFTLADAENIAEACNFVDIQYDPAAKFKLLTFDLHNQCWHFNINDKFAGGSDNDTRIIHAKNCLQRAITLYNNGGKTNKEKALTVLGMGLHALQDVFAHADMFVSKYGWFYSHADDRGWYADDPLHINDGSGKPLIPFSDGVVLKFLNFALNVFRLPANLIFEIKKTAFDLHNKIDPPSTIPGEEKFNRRFSDTKTATYIYLLVFLIRTGYWHKNGIHKDTNEIIDSLITEHNFVQRLQISNIAMLRGFLHFIKEMLHDDALYTRIIGKAESRADEELEGIDKGLIPFAAILRITKAITAGFIYNAHHPQQKNTLEALGIYALIELKRCKVFYDKDSEKREILLRLLDGQAYERYISALYTNWNIYRNAHPARFLPMQIIFLQSFLGILSNIGKTTKTSIQQPPETILPTETWGAEEERAQLKALEKLKHEFVSDAEIIRILTDGFSSVDFSVVDRRNLHGLDADIFRPYRYAIGNCLFETIALLDPQVRNGARVRALAAEQIEVDQQLRDHIRILAQGKNNQLQTVAGESAFHDVNEYLELIRQDQTWGGQIELVAIMRRLGRPIVILTPNNLYDQIIEEEDDDDYAQGDPIFINYVNNNHYEPLAVPPHLSARAILEEIRTAITQRKQTREIVNSRIIVQSDSFENGSEITIIFLLDDVANYHLPISKYGYYPAIPREIKITRTISKNCCEDFITWIREAILQEIDILRRPYSERNGLYYEIREQVFKTTAKPGVALTEYQLHQATLPVFQKIAALFNIYFEKQIEYLNRELSLPTPPPALLLHDSRLAVPPPPAGNGSAAPTPAGSRGITPASMRGRGVPALVGRGRGVAPHHPTGQAGFFHLHHRHCSHHHRHGHCGHHHHHHHHKHC